jgi:hypothetical protein
MSTTTPATDQEQETFVETALKLSGKSAEEAAKTGAIDRADEQVEKLFSPKHQTTGSPVHRAVWDNELPADLFVAPQYTVPADVREVMQKSIAVVNEHRRNKTLYNEAGKVSTAALEALSQTGYWGLLVPKEYGGQGARFQSFGPFLTEMAIADATVAGLASVHGCIGAIDPLIGFGTEEQKRRILPVLDGGKRLSAFALTEPCAGSDLTALRTKAVLDGNDYVVNGEKLFITNAIAGRTIGLVCLIDNKPAVLIADLPDEENDHFHTKKYGLYALKRSYNNGLVFRDFRVPKDNLLQPARGDGLTIAYHGLNRGRVAPAFCRGAASARLTGRPSIRANWYAAASGGWRRSSSVATRSPIGAPGCSTKGIAARWNASSPRSSPANRRKRRRSSF